MKIYSTSSLLLAGCFIIGVSGCNKKQDDAQKAVAEMSKSIQQMQQNTTGGSAGKSPGVAVPAKTLASFLPAVSGYTTKGDPETMEMEMQGAKYSHANQTYQNGDKHIKVSILDYNYIAGLSAAYGMMMNMSLETNEESMHSEQFGGNPGWVDWKKKSNQGTVGVVVSDRIYVITEAENGATLDDLKSVANSINYSGIALAAK